MLALPARPPVPKRLSLVGMIQLFPGSQNPVNSETIAPEDIVICRGSGALLRFSFSHDEKLLNETIDKVKTIENY